MDVEKQGKPKIDHELTEIIDEGSRMHMHVTKSEI